MGKCSNSQHRELKAALSLWKLEPLHRERVQIVLLCVATIMKVDDGDLDGWGGRVGRRT